MGLKLLDACFRVSMVLLILIAFGAVAMLVTAIVMATLAVIT